MVSRLYWGLLKASGYLPAISGDLRFRTSAHSCLKHRPIIHTSKHKEFSSQMAIKDCDVFLSFRGDVRNNFICHLNQKLKHQGFQPFFDTENICIGDEIDGTIRKAIKYSKSAIVVFSQNYASSRNCLKELELILERRRMSSSYFVIPIFYHVKAADLKYERGFFPEGFKHVAEHNSEDKIKEWKKACAEAGHIFGDEINEEDPRMQTEIIEDIVESFEQKFSENYHSTIRKWITNPYKFLGS